MSGIFPDGQFTPAQVSAILALIGGGGSFPELNGGNSWTGLQSITPDVGKSAIQVVGVAQTVSAPVFTASQEFNNAAVAFIGFDLSFQDTASATGSVLFRVRGGVAGTTNFISVDKSGTFNVPGTGNFGAISLTGVLLQSYEVFINNGGGLFLGVGGNRDARLYADGANILAQRFGAAAQEFRVYNTFTNSTNYERGVFRWSGNNFLIGSEAAGTGAARNTFFIHGGNTQLTIGAFGPFLQNNGYLSWSGRSGFESPADGNLKMRNSADSGFGLLQFGGVSASFPGLKRSSATLQARLADDSGFTFVQGKLQTDAAAVTETIVVTKTLTLYDSAGTACKVPCA